MCTLYVWWPASSRLIQQGVILQPKEKKLLSLSTKMKLKNEKFEMKQTDPKVNIYSFTRVISNDWNTAADQSIKLPSEVQNINQKGGKL